MGQVTIYIDAETEKRMQAAIEKKKVSKSKWITDLIRRETRDKWPEEVTALAGAWKDLPEVETIRDGETADLARERL